MERWTFIKIAIAFALMVFGLSAAPPAETRAEQPAVDPAAAEILQQMTDYLGSLRQFSVKTQNTLEEVLDTGHRIDVDVSADVIVSRPNRLYSERKGDQLDQVFYYNGKTLTLYNPSSNVYATKPVPGTFEELFKYMYEQLGFGIPISDLVYEDAYPLLTENVNFAALVGTSYINGIRCNHLLFSRPGVDFQVWVSDSDKPLPTKYVITDTENQPYLSIITTMTGWNVEPVVKDGQFDFAVPKDAQKIDFMPY